jgi:hypothetical protein
MAMESLIPSFFLYQWQRKLLALLTATVIWFFVNHSITTIKTIPSVPIRVINLPTDKTIQGLLPNGFLTKRTSLTISGTKNVIDQLEPGDLEVILDVSHLPDEGMMQISKKNLVSLNPNFNLLHHVTSIHHPDFVIKMSAILTEKIPIIIRSPLGDPPKGYEFLDVWPTYLYQTVSGPQDQVLQLKNQGLELTFNLNDISREQLDALQGNGIYDDEINFYIPDLWKKVAIPLSNRGEEFINDLEAKELHLSFLRQQMIPIKNDIPLHIFYPLKYSKTINPQTYPLAVTPLTPLKNHLSVLKVPLFVKNVSQLFLEIVKDNIEIDIIASSSSERESMEWGVSFSNEIQLENTYVAFLLSNHKSSGTYQTDNQQREKYLRQRFRTYLQRFSLYLSPEDPLELSGSLEENKIRVKIPRLSAKLKQTP